MSDPNFSEPPSDESSWNDALVDSLLRESANGGDADEAFLASVEEAIDAESESTERIIPMPHQNTRRPWLWSSGIAAVLVAGIAVVFTFTQLQESREAEALAFQILPPEETAERDQKFRKASHSARPQDSANSGNAQLRGGQAQPATPLFGETARSTEWNENAKATIPGADRQRTDVYYDKGQVPIPEATTNLGLSETEREIRTSDGIVAIGSGGAIVSKEMAGSITLSTETRAKPPTSPTPGLSAANAAGDKPVSTHEIDALTITLSSLDYDDSSFLKPTTSIDGAEPQRNRRLAQVGHGGKSFAYGDASHPDAVELQIAEPIQFGRSVKPVETEFKTGLSEALIAPSFGVEAELPIVGATFRNTARPAYGPLVDNPWFSPLDEPLSTFSIDVDTASWTNLRAMIRDGRSADSIPNDAVRIEELINYFDWDYPQPGGEHPFALATEIAQCPWNENHRLLRVGIQGHEMARTERPDANLVFLLDVSGSMNKPNKLPLVKRAISVLVEELEERDTVSIVVYAGAEGLALKPTSGRDQVTIQDALEKLGAGGSTNGGAGIKLAYKMAREQFKDDGINRVILCTDGDFNVGTTGTEELVSLVEQEAESGVFLSVCGFGQDNLNDAMLEEITNKGNGNYSYIDGFREARKVFLQDLMGTLVTIAKDVKIQIEFNPSQVDGYRLIGYANRKLEAEDFENDEIDAGEVGSGHAVTALYEIVPAGAKDNPADDEIALRYQEKDRPAPERKLIPSGELALLKLRYKQPDGEQSILMEQPVMPSGKRWERASEDFRFASAVGLFGMILREHESVGEANFQDVIAIASKAKGADPQGWRAEFVDLVRQLADR